MNSIFGALLLTIFTPNAGAAEIKVAAAADLQFAMAEIIQSYSSLHADEKVSATYGASGKFVAQIKEGAPFDLFFSADTEKVEELMQAGKTAGALFPYAEGHLVLWVRNESKLKLDGALNCLLDPSIKKIAVANPLLAPYGKAAENALKQAGLSNKVADKLVIGENISQTAQFVESSAAEIGLIAKSLALSPTLKKEGRFVEVDSRLYAAPIQAGVLLKSENWAAAKKFRDYFLGAEGKKILRSFGLSR